MPLVPGSSSEREPRHPVTSRAAWVRRTRPPPPRPPPPPLVPAPHAHREAQPGHEGPTPSASSTGAGTSPRLPAAMPSLEKPTGRQPGAGAGSPGAAPAPHPTWLLVASSRTTMKESRQPGHGLRRRAQKQVPVAALAAAAHRAREGLHFPAAAGGSGGPSAMFDNRGALSAPAPP